MDLFFQFFFFNKLFYFLLNYPFTLLGETWEKGEISLREKSHRVPSFPKKGEGMSCYLFQQNFMFAPRANYMGRS